MKFYEAKVADIIRSSQRDDNFVNELQNYLTSIIKSFGNQNYNRLRKLIPPISTAWYYLFTSVSNLQTLGEEYTGTIRLDGTQKIPAKYWQILWLILYVGGEPILDRTLQHLEKKTSKNYELKDEARRFILKNIKFVKNNKELFIRLHQSLFYINGAYYNISNRLTSIRYVLVRQWLQNDAATQSFSILGKISFFYTIFCLIRNYINEGNNLLTETLFDVAENGKICVLCTENRHNTCSTLCGHLFCWTCIFDSLKFQKACPICREIINPSRIIFLQNYS
ncbi:peroxisome assembly protein 10-A-like [Onthophagus taurus]|uniref:peroxisome assembly protein 10-A-like n=1 Tax=Onthophagus taurus TaxID=166361 RepID=UPI000C2097CB|nr:peroxisome biogenesis factor 10-like [Onthophagus taurus]